MASELRGIAPTGSSVYVHILNSSGQRWNGTVFETYAAGNYSNYSISLTEQGSSGAFFGDFPAALTLSGTYEYLVYLQNGGSPAQGDAIVGTGKVNWSGTGQSDVISGAMSGPQFLAYVKKIFKRTDKDDEIYDAITDAISELRRLCSFDEDEVEVSTTDTIATVGDYRLNVEDNMGILIGDVQVIDSDDSRPLTKLDKQIFDIYYPNQDATNVTKDKPQHFAVFAGQIYLGPVPDKTSYTYRVNYSKGMSTISSSTTSVPFTKWYREGLREGVLAKVWSGLEEDLAAEHQAKWQFFKDQIMRREDMNQKGTGFVLYHGI